MCFESTVLCECFRSLKESLWLLYLVLNSCCHANVGPCVTRGCCDSCFVDNVLCKARTVKRVKVFASTVAFLFVGGLVVFIKYFVIVAFDYISHVCSAAVADLQVVSIKYFVELV